MKSYLFASAASTVIRGCGVFLLSVILLGTAHAYPLAPSTWTWRYHEDSNFYPRQIAATTDPDGRLRTLFTNRSGFLYFSENDVSHRVHHVIMLSFRPLGATILDDYVAADLGSYTGVGRERSMSDAASLQLRRNSVYSVLGPAGSLSYGGSYQRLLIGETIGDMFFPSNTYDGDFLPMTGRVVLKSRFDWASSAFGGAQGNVLAQLAAPGTTQNQINLTNRSGGDVRLDYYENNGRQATLSFGSKLSASAPAGWTTSRIITGGSLAVTADRRDFYAFVTSYKILADSTFTTEARIFRLRTAATTSLNGDGDPVIDIASVTTKVIHAQSLAAGSDISKAMKYPTVLLTSSGLPKWVGWENASDKLIHWSVKNAVTGGTAEENSRSIANGYEAPFSATVGAFFSNAAGPCFAMDRLGKLHLTFQDISNPATPLVRYTRENAAGGVENAISLGGSCTTAPALAMGPGDYPYVVYQGFAPSSGAFDKLVIAYPSGLADAYRDDYEDRDGDGRSGLLEYAQGSSDTKADLPLAFGPSITTVPGTTLGTLKPRLTFVVNGAATHVAQEQYQIVQGGDTIDIRLGYSYGDNALKAFNVGGFARVSEVPFLGVKTITADDNIIIGSPFYKGFYRLQVTRNPGPP